MTCACDIPPIQAVHPMIGAQPHVCYFIHAHPLHRVKIGTTGNVAKRMFDLQTASPVPLRLLAVALGGVSYERSLHRRFARDRLHGEWFMATDDVLSAIMEIRAAYPAINQDAPTTRTTRT